MPESDLPFEILSHIAIYVLNDDKPACMMTCKRWKIPFQESVWKTIEIDSFEKLEEICTIANNSTSRLPPYDLTTEIIRIHRPCNIRELQKTQAFRTFQNLKHLDIGAISYELADFGFTRYVPDSTSLVSLKLKIKAIDGIISTPITIGILGHMPNLQKIDIYPELSIYKIQFKLHQFNHLHTLLPKLTAIKLSLSFHWIHPKAVPSIPQTDPAPSVTTLDLEIIDWDHIWLYYFSFKYPNLRNLLSFDIKNIVTPKLSHCPRLVDLEIKCCGVSIALDNVLDNCTALRRLSFCNGLLYINPETNERPIQHGLRTLELDTVTTKSFVFNYISSRCRDLEYMALIQTQIYESVSEKTKGLHINMSYTNFKKLYLDHVLFYLSDDFMNMNITIKLVLLSQLTDPRKTNKDPEHGNVESFATHIAWFHLSDALKNNTSLNSLDITQLSEEDGYDITRQFLDFQLKRNYNSQEAKTFIREQTSVHPWKKDICEGCVEFTCGRINEYRIL
ncbi:hypothetical protein PHYBLDRAFT_78086 [Phycomyces blakesleeanus NRRL 1555(-)]|uniref:F-box domain-containing protein n=1 Tax=Phycomyces blakesleeanus (strain ATCC 8743b / DSM 1359 / FGSC 10004 / NBRC 33097 / NRRL 1555) TaxID=763407 RepID=A0A167MCM4_PHYB8|nr:hypothetical protein PHYBLDRAFT_78086 [Phycomyces blakesleeanus NRRL 1555(-)]OAD72474.1 hypothetical protein PHYBLDRAFT_78086 [Phycomyces blakesleeanus NRRL 1555(-)]|eukprot:XP_018290514.1 hypothetical protein PHYBLDRAFT_78086 [Phycomyces blakesleeanus NRRL 1555(-)]